MVTTVTVTALLSEEEGLGGGSINACRGKY